MANALSPSCPSIDWYIEPLSSSTRTKSSGVAQSCGGDDGGDGGGQWCEKATPPLAVTYLPQGREGDGGGGGDGGSRGFASGDGWGDGWGDGSGDGSEPDPA